MATKHSFEQSRALRILRDDDHVDGWHTAKDIDTEPRILESLVKMKEIEKVVRSDNSVVYRTLDS